jgi:hypothetical protein
MSNHSTRSIERWNEMFERLVQYKKRKHGEEAPQQGGQTDKEEVSSSFGFWLDTQKNFWQDHKVGSDDILDERYQPLLSGLGGLGEFETVTKKGISSQEERWNDMCETLLDFKQKHGRVKVPVRYKENPKLGTWVSHWRSQYRAYKRTNGQKGDSERMKRLEGIGLVDDIIFRKKEDKKTKCADNKVVAPIVVSSMSLTFPSNNQSVTNKEMTLSTGMKRKKNDEKADLDFLGSELRGKGGFWI